MHVHLDRISLLAHEYQVMYTRIPVHTLNDTSSWTVKRCASSRRPKFAQFFSGTLKKKEDFSAFAVPYKAPRVSLHERLVRAKYAGGKS